MFFPFPIIEKIFGERDTRRETDIGVNVRGKRHMT